MISLEWGRFAGSSPQLLCLEVLVVVRALQLGPWVMYWVPRDGMECPDYNIRLMIHQSACRLANLFRHLNQVWCFGGEPSVGLQLSRGTVLSSA
jgi:hypothetical protein